MKTRTRKNRLLSILLSFALVVTLFAGLGITASAVTQSGYWTDAPNYDTSWYRPGQTTYTIADEAGFAGLAYLVNNGTETFAGATVSLTVDLDMSAHYWYPIGGVSPLSGGVPSGYYFAGIFDGYSANTPATYNTHVINGVYVQFITTTPANNSGYGLFGYVNGGIIQNLSLGTGAVDVGANNVSEIGGFVGYTNGTIFNLHNIGTTVNVTNASASQAGGVAGTVENIAANTTIYVQYCSNQANVTGRGRVGGIVGAVYNASAVGTVVDLCFNRGNELTTVGTTQKSYTGGIVGYCRGYIADSYSYNATLTTSGGHYIAGLVGIIQGISPAGALYNSYTTAVFNGASPSYDRFIFASLDSSNTMTINNSLWLDNNPQPGNITLVQPNATGSNGWGNWTQVGTFTSPSTTSVWTTSTGATTTPATLDVLNAQGSFTLADGSTVYQVGGDFGQSTTINDGYPYLLWEQTPGIIPRDAPNTPVVAPTDYDPADGATGAIFLDGTAAAGGNGTKANPYNTFADAARAAQAWTGIQAIYVRGEVGISPSSATTWTLPAGFTVYRSSIYDGYLFDIEGTAPLTLSAITVDGNSSYVTHNFPSGTLALFEVSAGGTLTVGTNVILQNNTSRVGGGAIDAVSGTVNITGGTILNNVGADGGALHVEANSTATMNGGILEKNTAYHGGAVYVEYEGTFNLAATASTEGTISNNTANNSGGGVDTRGTFNMTGGTISGNTSADGGGVAVLARDVDDPGILNMSGGTITGNVVKSTVTTAHGGGIYIATGGEVNLTGGTITNNTSTGDANGIYVSASNELTLSPASGALTFGTNDVIYLPEDVTFDIGADLATGVTGYVYLSFENPQVNDIVAVADTAALAASSVAKLSSGTIIFAQQVRTNNIIISSLTKS
jgi:hypothetical protein